MRRRWHSRHSRQVGSGAKASREGHRARQLVVRPPALGRAIPRCWRRADGPAGTAALRRGLREGQGGERQDLRAAKEGWGPRRQCCCEKQMHGENAAVGAQPPAPNTDPLPQSAQGLEASSTWLAQLPAAPVGAAR